MRRFTLAAVLIALGVAGCSSGTRCCRRTTCETKGNGSSTASAGTSSPTGGATRPVAAAPGMSDGHPAAAAPVGATTARAGDTVANVDSERSKATRPTVATSREFIRRYRALGAMDKAKEVAGELLAFGDPNDAEAHELLGHMEFTGEVPEEISFRKYPFVRAVDEARAQRTPES